jgi:cell division protein FtsQ
VAAAALAVLLILAGGWIWLRGSSLVAVERVRITGVAGPGAVEIRGALRAAARRMTTLEVNARELRTVVRAYPAVRGIAVSAQFPHGIVIRVSERVAIAEIVVAGQAIAVAPDGTLLGDAVPAYGALPAIPLRRPPARDALTAPGALAAAAVLGGAPRALLAEIRDATRTAAHGVVVDLHNGPSLYFGAATQIAAKWQAAIAVLGNPACAGAPYVDVSDPQRPAAGGLSDSASVPPAPDAASGEAAAYATPTGSGATLPTGSGATSPAASGATSPAASGATSPAAPGATLPAASDAAAPAASGATPTGGEAATGG